jgi:hypothetical protein
MVALMHTAFGVTPDVALIVVVNVADAGPTKTVRPTPPAIASLTPNVPPHEPVRRLMNLTYGMLASSTRLAPVNVNVVGASCATELGLIAVKLGASVAVAVISMVAAPPARASYGCSMQ